MQVYEAVALVASQVFGGEKKKGSSERTAENFAVADAQLNSIFGNG